MTAKEFFEKYAGVVVSFHSYYKYTFDFRGETEDGVVIYVAIGGDSDSIYTYDVSHNTTHTLDADSAYEFFSGTSIKDGKVVDEFYDY